MSSISDTGADLGASYASRLVARGEGTLIPDDDEISELLEDLRLRHGSFKLLPNLAAPLAVVPPDDRLIGITILEGAVDMVPASPVGETALAERLESADFVLVTPGHGCRLEPVPGGPCVLGQITYGIDMDRARILLRLLPPSFVVRQVEEEEVEWQLTLSQLIAQRSESGRSGSAAVNRRLVEAALIAVIQQYLRSEGRDVLSGASPSLAAIAPGIHAMHHNPDHRWTIAELARLSAMSRTLFVEKFVAGTGEPPGRYLARLRMERARELLRHSSLPLAAVAHRAGYGTDVSFARAFKRHFGVSPGRFRTSEQQSQSQLRAH